MQAHSWKNGKIYNGIALQNDEKFGKIVFLGEAGRGRRYERISLSKHNPANIVNDRVHVAYLKKITIPAKDEKPEFSFFVLEKPKVESNSVIVRIDTYSSYIRNGYGSWKTLEGSPETVISGYGAFGDPGRIGNWNDGLVIMKAGDAVQVHPIRSINGISEFALWVDENNQLQTASLKDYQQLKALAEVQELVESVEDNELEVMFGEMKAFTYKGKGNIVSGIKVSQGSTGKVICLGEEGRGREKTEVALINKSEDTLLEKSAVVLLKEEKIPARSYYGEEETKRIFGFVNSARCEDDKLLVRVNIGSPNRGHYCTKILRGEPVLIAKGEFASGTAGRAGSADDSIWVLGNSDAVVICYAMYEKQRVIQNVNGKLVTSIWEEWEIADGIANPESYVESGKAPYGHIPKEWIGKVVSVIAEEEYYDSRKRETRSHYREIHEGELCSINPLVLNIGCDGCDRIEVAVNKAVWIKLDPNKAVRIPDESEVSARENAKKKAQAIKDQASDMKAAKHFECLPDYMQNRITEIVNSAQEDFKTEDINYWCERSEKQMQEVKQSEEKAKADYALKEKGYFLPVLKVKCDVRYGQGRVWVINPDGSIRSNDDLDECHYRYKIYVWKMISKELVIAEEVLWIQGGLFGAGTGVVYRPEVVTSEQLEAVKKIEKEYYLEDTFEVDLELVAKRAKMVEEIRSEILKVSPEEILNNLRFIDVVGKDGLKLQMYYDEVAPLINYAMPFEEGCEGREAQVVKKVFCANGVLEFLAYEKWGTKNLNVRWRALREDEGVNMLQAVSEVQADKVEDLSNVDFSNLFGGVAKVNNSRK